MVGPSHVQERITHAILQRGMGGTFYRKPPADKAWCRMIVELPHHRGGLAITPLPASGIVAFYHATARLVAWLGSLPQSHSSQCAQNQNLAYSTTWTSSSLYVGCLLQTVPLSPPSRQCILNSLPIMGALNGLCLLLMTLMMLLLHSNELMMMPMLALSPSHH